MRERAPRTTPTLFAFLFLLCGLVTAAPLAAQQGAKDPGSTAEARKIPEKQLDHFADAYLAVSQVRKTMGQQMKNAGSKKERQKIQSTENRKMASIIKDNGLTIQQYRRITTTLNQDQAQRQEFIKIVQAKRTGGDDDGPSGG